MNIIKKFFSKNEKFSLNKEVVNRRNYNVLGIILLTVILIYLIGLTLTIISNYNEYMLIPQLGVIVGLSTIFIIYKFLVNKNILFFFYFIIGLLFLFIIYTSFFLKPDKICITILFLLFLQPVLILDYEWRVDLITFIYGLIYMILLIFFKEGEVFNDEFFNVIAVLCLAFVLTHFFNKTNIENIDLKRLSDIAAYTDYLTGLANRTSLFKQLENSSINNDIQGVLLIDVDYFKRFNDTYGHQKGDECLRRVTNVFKEVKQLLGCIDAYRYGGEEFVIIVYKGKHSIYDVAESIRQSVEVLSIDHEKSTHKYVTISVGVAKVRELDFDYNELLHQADMALYDAKACGRNMVKYYRPKDHADE